MSWTAIKMAFQADTGPGAAAKLVLVAIAYRVNGDGRAWPSITTIIEDTGLSRRAVYRAVRQLVDGGHLTALGRPGHSTIYGLSTGADMAHPGGATLAQRGATLAQRGAMVAPISSKGTVKERGGCAKHPSGCPCRGTGWLESWDPAAKALIAVACPDGPQP